MNLYDVLIQFSRAICEREAPNLIERSMWKIVIRNFALCVFP